MLNLISSLFDKNTTKPKLDHSMRTHAYDSSKDRLYLYAFGNVEINGYFIREEITMDLVLRGLPMTARLGVTGDLFVDDRGAGIVGVQKWNGHDPVQELAAVELDTEAERLEQNAPVNYIAPGSRSKRRIGFV